MNYPPELLEYLGLNRTLLTYEFDYVRGTKQMDGLIKVEGDSKVPIKDRSMGSLAIAVFKVKEGLDATLPIILFNTDKDIFDVKKQKGFFNRHNGFRDVPRLLIQGKGEMWPDGTYRIPIRVSSGFNIASFGLVFRYPIEKMAFLGVKKGDLTKNYLDLDGNEIEAGIVRVGGYSLSEIQNRKPGILFELIFSIHGDEDEIEILETFDDIKDFVIKNKNAKLR